MKSKHKTPEIKYDLLGTTITIIYQDRVESDEGQWLYGMCRECGDKTTIFISTKDDDGHPMTKESIARTLRHELYHAILDRGQYFNSSEDEPLVEWLATCTDILNKQGCKI